MSLGRPLCILVALTTNLSEKEERLMAQGAKPSRKKGAGTTLNVSTKSRPDFDHPLSVLVFNRAGALLETVEVKGGKASLDLPEKRMAGARVWVVPSLEEEDLSGVTPSRLEKLGGFRPVMRAGSSGEITKLIEIPGSILDLWPFCFCWVQGRVVRSSDGRPICNARVHVCEVDRIPIWIQKLPDPDLLRLRDDLIDALRKPWPRIPPEPLPDPPGPGPDPMFLQRSLIRMNREHEIESMASVERTASDLPLDATLRLESQSPFQVRQALVENWKILLPYLCLWPWWWRFRCDEVAVITTGESGRFQKLITYPCGGDKPDLYFWVEYDFGTGFETVYKPSMACRTHWDYPCGEEVILRVPDPRIPACEGEPSLDGKQVWVMSVGRRVSIGEIYTAADGTLEGMVREPFGTGQEDFAFGGKLEPRVWFGREALIADGITHYLWSVRPLGGTEADWSPLNRQVIRHYTTGAGTAPVEVMGPEPGGANMGHFQIRPLDPPTGGIEWIVGDEREDLASAHFVTRPPDIPTSTPVCGVADPEAGKYELKMELFDSSGGKVVWEDHGITLRVAIGEAPFGDDPINTQVAADYNRIKDSGGKTVAFRMVLHVDNSRSRAVIDAISGTGVAIDPSCGVVTLTGPSPSLEIGFHAGRPGGLARMSLATKRGLASHVSEASAAGSVSDVAINGFVRSPSCHFAKPGIPASTMLGVCGQAAFSETLRVWALSQDGYHRLTGLDGYDVAAFMLTVPCPPCPPCDQAPGQGDGSASGMGQGQGQGLGKGQGGGQGQGGGRGSGGG